MLKRLALFAAVATALCGAAAAQQQPKVYNIAGVFYETPAEQSIFGFAVELVCNCACSTRTLAYRPLLLPLKETP